MLRNQFLQQATTTVGGNFRQTKTIWK